MTVAQRGRALLRRAVAEALLLASLLSLAGFLFHHGLADPPDFDEAVYLAAVDAFRHGQELGAQVFTAQPPGFYTMLRAGEAVFGHTVAGGRDTIVALALLGLVGAYAIGRAYAGPAAGLGAAGLLAVSPSYSTFAAKISADLPGLAVCLVALAVLLWLASRRPALAFGLCGALGVLGLSIKLSAITLLVPIVCVAWLARARLREALVFAAGAGAAALAFVLGFRGELGGIWHGAVTYHAKARGAGGPGLSDNLHRVVHFLDFHTPFGWLVLIAIVLALSPWRAHLRLPVWPLWAWAVAAAAFLVWHRPLHDNHMVLLAITLAVPAGTILGAGAAAAGSRRALAAGLALLLALTAGFVQERRRFARNEGAVPTEVRWVAGEVDRRTRPDELVVTDQPLVDVLAHRRSPGRLIDTAVLRFDSGFLTDREVLDVIDRDRIRVVVADRAFLARPAILAGLRRRFPTRLERNGLELYARG